MNPPRSNKEEGAPTVGKHAEADGRGTSVPTSVPSTHRHAVRQPDFDNSDFAVTRP